jgi:5-oxoprolinase (ATP-hydrolysing) subunit A
MKRTVDLNADMGESFGPWKMGDDAAVLKTVTSANIACGFHAGDPDVMAATMRAAIAGNVGIGAHPGFADLQDFGRRRMNLPKERLQNMIRYQMGAAIGMAQGLGAKVRHFKLHGAMGNMTAEDGDMARICYEAALSVDPDTIIMVQSTTAQEQAARDLGCNWAGEIFADRAYNDDGTLVDRSQPGAVIHDPEEAGARILDMVNEGAIITTSGKRIPASIDTICLHGDTPTAVFIAGAVKAKLLSGGVELAQFQGRR